MFGQLCDFVLICGESNSFHAQYYKELPCSLPPWLENVLVCNQSNTQQKQFWLTLSFEYGQVNKYIFYFAQIEFNIILKK